MARGPAESGMRPTGKRAAAVRNPFVTHRDVAEALFAGSGERSTDRDKRFPKRHHSQAGCWHMAARCRIHPRLRERDLRSGPRAGARDADRVSDHVRAYARLHADRTRAGWGSAHVGNAHMHHLVVGLVLAFVAGALQFASSPTRASYSSSSPPHSGPASRSFSTSSRSSSINDVYWERL